MSQASDLLKIISSGVESVRPSLLFSSILSHPEGELQSWQTSEKRYLLCLGKAAIDSAKAVLPLVDCKDYFVLAPYEDPEKSIKVHRGSHPIPRENSFRSTEQMIEWLKEKPSGASLLVVLSGGTSALCAMPVPTVSLDAKIQVNDLLIRSGASIREMNTVRKHLSRVKGGQLAGFASQMKILVLVISDVIGDDLATIGSGPFYPDPTTFLEAKQVLQRYILWNEVQPEVRTAIEDGISGKSAETPKPGSLQIPHRVIASNRIARKAAAAEAEKLGYKIQPVEDILRGDVADAAVQIYRRMLQAPVNSALIWGGEITIRVTGKGMGGRNQHLTLLMTEKLRNSKSFFAAAGTDGIDGNSPAAGAWTDSETYDRASGSGSFRKAVTDFDAYHYFEALGQNIVTGPTGTNVMDLYVGLK